MYDPSVKALDSIPFAFTEQGIPPNTVCHLSCESIEMCGLGKFHVPERQTEFAPLPRHAHAKLSAYYQHILPFRKIRHVMWKCNLDVRPGIVPALHWAAARNMKPHGWLLVEDSVGFPPCRGSQISTASGAARRRYFFDTFRYGASHQWRSTIRRAARLVPGYKAS